MPRIIIKHPKGESKSGKIPLRLAFVGERHERMQARLNEIDMNFFSEEKKLDKLIFKVKKSFHEIR